MASLICLVILSITLYHEGVRGISPSSQPILNLKTENGRFYDYVDVYKQLTFDHPSLKSQISKVRPSSVEEVERKPKGIGLKQGGRPIGSVPILRVNTTANQNLTRSPPNKRGPKEHCIAVVQTTLDDSNRKFYGSSAAISLHNPLVQDLQWCSARIKLLNGQDSIEAGWMINPTIFKDDEAHLYAKFQAGEKGCVNLQCPGFVQVSKDIALGIIPEHYSTIGRGPKYSWNISVEKHSEDGHWWVILTGPKDRFPIGYWPKNIFTSLADVANQVEWGGEAGNPERKWPYADMGNSLKASYDTTESAYFRHVTVDTESTKFVEPQGTKKVFDCPIFYTVLDAGHKGDFWGRLMFYGGYH